MNRILSLLCIILALAVSGGRALAQTTTVTGKVSDAATGSALAGVEVRVEGAQAETSLTDDQGNYSIAVPSGASGLVFVYPDFGIKKVAVRGRSSLDVSLFAAGTSRLDRSNNLPYGSVLERNFSAGTATVTADQLGNAAQPTPDRLLEGRIAGLRVTPRSAMAGEGASMLWRGAGTFEGRRQPLIIVDGTPIETETFGVSTADGFFRNSLADIDPQDIESVVFLKDAVSIYGSKASAGVLVIETNRADETKTTVDFSAYGGVIQAPEKMPLLNASQFRGLASELLSGSGQDKKDLQLRYPFLSDDKSVPGYYRYANDTDWQDEVYESAVTQNYRMKLKGGDEIARYALSLGYTSQEGVVKGTGYDRYNFRFNSDVRITEKLFLSPRIGFSYSEYELSAQGTDPRTNPVLASYAKAPIMGVYARSETGETLPYYDPVGSFNVSNPVALLSGMDVTNRNYRFLWSNDLTYKFDQNLALTYRLGIDFNKMRENVFVPATGVAAIPGEGAVNNSRHQTERFTSYYNDLFLTYNKNFGQDHRLNAVTGLRYKTNSYELDEGQDQNTPSDDFKSVGQGRNVYDRVLLGRLGDWNWASYYLSADYAFRDKYMVNASVSIDGSSRYGADADQVGVFPAVGAAWRISSEDFLNQVRAIDDLKLRINYGLTGDDMINANHNGAYYRSVPWNGVGGLVSGGVGNPDLKWEQTASFTIGADLSLFDERLSLTIDRYSRVTSDVVVEYEMPSIYNSTYFANTAEITNQGWELAVDAKILRGEVSLDAGFNIAANDSELNSIGKSGIPTTLPKTSVVTGFGPASFVSMEGAAPFQYYGHRALGVLSTSGEAETANLKNADGTPFQAGDMKFEDLDGNGIINDKDKTAIGDPNPDYFGGAYANVSYKGFSLSAYADFAGGFDVFNYERMATESMTGLNNQSAAVLNRWQAEGQLTDIPKATLNDPMGNGRFSNRWIEDGTYVRLKTLTLAYRTEEKTKVYNSLRVFFTVDNVFNSNDYLGSDPFQGMASPLAVGSGYGRMPQTRSFVLGFQLGL
ncbi:SusC/RagA family TonB-linked outer membrane protein (plasmid) [Fulvitalea axinellae]|uniref:SusC/RagA family TonB-linked outer membrane protein n=1 Tax=Fulvitalea axinellae TaxID=1182444 RepID=A0AAU9DF99_9BACT|nr:SusC/RagA family TonB-linked outer membrane protein [Fulvitalea axinellae]